MRCTGEVPMLRLGTKALSSFYRFFFLTTVIKNKLLRWKGEVQGLSEI